MYQVSILYHLSYGPGPHAYFLCVLNVRITTPVWTDVLSVVKSASHTVGYLFGFLFVVVVWLVFSKRTL